MAIGVARRVLSGLLFLSVMVVMTAGVTLAHEERQVAGYDMEVGFIDEPVFVGQRSGLEFSVMKDGQPVTGLADTLKAEVIYGDAKRDLPVSARPEEDGWYESYFFPTAAGAYTFHIYGTIDGQPIDEGFTSSPSGFSEVLEATAGQFPVTQPLTADLAADASRGASAADQMPIALGLGAIAVVLGIVAIGLAIGLRRTNT